MPQCSTDVRVVAPSDAEPDSISDLVQVQELLDGRVRFSGLLLRRQSNIVGCLTIFRLLEDSLIVGIQTFRLEVFGDDSCVQFIAAREPVGGDASRGESQVANQLLIVVHRVQAMLDEEIYVVRE